MGNNKKICQYCKKEFVLEEHMSKKTKHCGLKCYFADKILLFGVLFVVSAVLSIVIFTFMVANPGWNEGEVQGTFFVALFCTVVSLVSLILGTYFSSTIKKV